VHTYVIGGIPLLYIPPFSCVISVVLGNNLSLIRNLFASSMRLGATQNPLTENIIFEIFRLQTIKTKLLLASGGNIKRI